MMMAEPDLLLALRAYGRTVALTGPRESLAAAREQLPPSYVTVDDATPEATWPAGGYDQRRVLSELEVWVAEHADGYIFVHAGCVAVNGRAILVPGRSMSGKSTLTAALVRAGADYLSDEYAVFDQEGRVHPYARPLSIRTGPLGGSVDRVQPSSLGATATEPARTGIIASLRYSPQVEVVSAERLTRGQTMLDLLANTVPAQARALESVAAAEAATEGAVGLRGTRGEADAAAAHLLELLADTE